MDIASGFHLIIGEKRKRAVFVFSLQIQWKGKIKDVLSWQVRKKRGNNLTRFNKPIAEKENFKQNQNLQTMKERCKHITSGSVCLSAYLSVFIPDCLSICLPVLQNGIYPVSPLLQQLHPILTPMLQISCQVVIKNLFPIQLLHITKQTPQFPYLHCLLHNKIQISLNSTLTLDEMLQL